jgi:hypothetical protein
MDFVSTTTGWVIQNPVNGVTPLYRTNNGGITWTLISGSAAPPTSTPTLTPTPTIPAAPSPGEFAQTVVNTLNAKNFDATKTLMDQSFMMAFWQSQGTAYTPDLAIPQLLTYIGPNTVLIPDPNKDLVALLGGSNPYSIMGLDPAKSQALFVSGWGLDGTSEAILYVTRRADGSLYYYGNLIAPGGFARFALTPTPTSTPTAPTPETVSHEAFCADGRIPILIEQLKGSMNQSNGDMFAGIVSPVHGVDVRLWAYGPAANYSPATARNVFTSTEVFVWGSGPVGGTEYGTGTFSQIIQPKMLEVFNAPNMETYCDNLTKVFPLSNPWPYPNIRYYNLYKPASAAFFDFRTWLIGFEYIDGQPHLYSMVSSVWEP